MGKRLKFNCWNCKRDYELFREIEGQPKLLVQCPYCRKDGSVDLNRFRGTTVELYKGAEADKMDLDSILQLPQVIPTSPPENEEA